MRRGRQLQRQEEIAEQAYADDDLPTVPRTDPVKTR
jgi:hypothetical protein